MHHMCHGLWWIVCHIMRNVMCVCTILRSHFYLTWSKYICVFFFLSTILFSWNCSSRSIHQFVQVLVLSLHVSHITWTHTHIPAWTIIHAAFNRFSIHTANFMRAFRNLVSRSHLTIVQKKNAPRNDHTHLTHTHTLVHIFSIATAASFTRRRTSPSARTLFPFWDESTNLQPSTFNLSIQ
jgi:hypothetical protein